MILVTGATGTVGRPLLTLLRVAGADVRAVTRDPAGTAVPDGVETVVGDPSRPAGLTEHLDGVTALFLHPRAVGDAAHELAALARKHGVRRIVALSATNIDDDLDAQPSRYRGDRNKEAEYAAVESGLEWTSLRVSAFAVNTIGMFGAQIRTGDVVRYVYPRFAEAPIHEQDIAGVAARALLTDELAGRRLELTGPQSLTHEQMVATIGDALGRPLRYEELPPQQAAQRMIANGFPEPFVAALMARYAREADARVHPTTDVVTQVLGRPARTYAGWVADHLTAFQNQGDHR